MIDEIDWNPAHVWQRWIGIGGDGRERIGEFGHAVEMATISGDEILYLRVVLSGCCILAYILD